MAEARKIRGEAAIDQMPGCVRQFGDRGNIVEKPECSSKGRNRGAFPEMQQVFVRKCRGKKGDKLLVYETRVSLLLRET
jgi:hypothetical protein